MKTEKQIRQMLGAIRRQIAAGVISLELGTAQEMILGWVLDALPPEYEAFQNAVGASKFERAMAVEGIGQDFTGSGDVILGVEEINLLPVTPGSCGPGVYRFGSGQIQNQCDMFHFWSLHPGGANFLYADGSVHFVNYGVAAILPALASRAAGEVVGAP